jgi:outer membrane protein assembly factor BamB
VQQPTTIDLGTVQREPSGDAGQDTTPERWRPRRTTLPRVGPVLVALLALPLSGGAPAPPAPLQPQWSVPIDGQAGPFSWHVDDQHLYVATADRTGGRDDGEGVVTAYRLADGQQQWRLPLQTWNVPSVRMVGDTVVVDTSGPAAHYTATIGVDRDTGTQRWTRPESPYYILVDQVLLVDDAGMADHDDPRMRLIIIDAATGQDEGTIAVEAWELVGIDVVDGQDSGGDRFLVTLSRDGTLTRHHVGTGTTTTADTPHAEREENVGQNWLAVQGDLLLVGARGGDEPAVLAVYDAGTLTHRWDHPHGVTATPCGTLVCVSVSEDNVFRADTVHAVDPATGATRWSRSCEGTGAAELDARPAAGRLAPHLVGARRRRPDRGPRARRDADPVLPGALSAPDLRDQRQSADHLEHQPLTRGDRKPRSPDPGLPAPIPSA